MSGTYMPDPSVAATTIWDVLKAIVEHKYAPITFAVFLAFLGAVIHTFVSSRTKRAKLAYKHYEELLRNLRSEIQIAYAENKRIGSKLESCSDALNRLEAKYELIKEQLDKCKGKN